MMKYRKNDALMFRWVLMLLLLVAPALVKAQPGMTEEQKEKLKAKRVEFISSRMSLTADEGQKFWPLFNELTDKKESIKMEMKSHLNAIKKRDRSNMSDSELEDVMDKVMKLRLKEEELDQEYYIKFKKVVSINKLINYYRAERDFKHELLREIRHKGQRNHPRREGIQNQ